MYKAVLLAFIFISLLSCSSSDAKSSNLIHDPIQDKSILQIAKTYIIDNNLDHEFILESAIISWEDDGYYYVSILYDAYENRIPQDEVLKISKTIHEISWYSTK